MQEKMTLQRERVDLLGQVAEGNNKLNKYTTEAEDRSQCVRNTATSIDNDFICTKQNGTALVNTHQLPTLQRGTGCYGYLTLHITAFPS